MKTIVHKLTSNPSVEVKVPEETPAHVEEFISMIKSLKYSDDLISKMDEHPYFKEMSYMTQGDLANNASKLKGTKSETLKLRYTDNIYLQISQHDLHIISDEADEMDNAINLTYGKIK